MDNMFKMGPREMKGVIWEEKDCIQIVEILITHQQDFINSIRFTYRMGDRVIHSPTYGEPSGLKFNIVEFDHHSEVLTSVRGEYLRNGRLASIVFGTNRRDHGPFGRTGSTSANTSYEDFNYQFKQGRFGGFHGSVSSGIVYAIGVYVKSYELPLQPMGVGPNGITRPRPNRRVVVVSNELGMLNSVLTNSPT